jgi:predicted ArsR family transcriptional regulator
MREKCKATRKELLRFIDKMGAVTYQMISQKFGLSEGRAANRLTELKRERMIVNMVRGEWIIAEYGRRRLIYYANRETNDKKEAG